MVVPEKGESLLTSLRDRQRPKLDKAVFQLDETG
jgi:hypothetical protein